MMQVFSESLPAAYILHNRIASLISIKSEHGWLGAIAFSSVALFLEARDRWIGWGQELLLANRDCVINMSCCVTIMG
jgi:hypothetical protein